MSHTSHLLMGSLPSNNCAVPPQTGFWALALPDTMLCPNCGHELVMRAAFCAHCGQHSGAQTASGPPVQRSDHAGSPRTGPQAPAAPAQPLPCGAAAAHAAADVRLSTVSLPQPPAVAPAVALLHPPALVSAAPQSAAVRPPLGPPPSLQPATALAVRDSPPGQDSVRDRTGKPDDLIVGGMSTFFCSELGFVFVLCCCRTAYAKAGACYGYSLLRLLAIAGCIVGIVILSHMKSVVCQGPVACCRGRCIAEREARGQTHCRDFGPVAWLWSWGLLLRCLSPPPPRPSCVVIAVRESDVQACVTVQEVELQACATVRPCCVQLCAIVRTCA